MYDEIERAVGATPRRGPSVLAWVAIAFVGFVLVGVGTAAYTFIKVRNEVREVMHRFDRGERVAISGGVSEIVGRALQDALAGVDPEYFASDPQAVEQLLRNLDAGTLDAQALEDIIEGSLRVRTDEGDVTVDLRGNEDGGELLIGTPDGPARLELKRSEQGGVLTITADGETVRFGAGDSAEGAPSWVPAVQGMPDRPRQVMSASSEGGLFGAVSWESDASPEAVVEAYREHLQDEGYALRGEHSMRGPESRNASVVGRNEESGRTVFLVATLEGGETRVLLGYGEGTGR